MTIAMKHDWQLDLVRKVHLELSSACNAACPNCPRFYNNSPLTRPSLVVRSISLEEFKTWFPPSFIKQLSEFDFCGNFGDPCSAPDILPIVEYLHEQNLPVLKIHSNTGMKTTKFWSRLGELFSKHEHWNMIFSVDGLEDTNHLYRRNVKWKKVEENIKAFTQFGGLSDWDYLIFEHNEEQIPEAKRLAKEWGVTRFVPKHPAGLDNGKESMSMPAIDKEGKLEYWIEPARRFENKGLMHPEGHIKPNMTFRETDYDWACNSRKKDYKVGHWMSREIKVWDKATITPRCLAPINQIYIDSTGTVFPCCWVGMVWPIIQDMKNIGIFSSYEYAQLWEKIDEYGLDNFDLNKHTLKDILEAGHLNKLFADTWYKPSCSEGKMAYCSKTCGGVNLLDKIYNHPDNENKEYPVYK